MALMRASNCGFEGVRTTVPLLRRWCVGGEEGVMGAGEPVRWLAEVKGQFWGILGEDVSWICSIL